MDNEPIAVSMVIPAYNEEAAIRSVLEEVLTAMNRIGRPFEIIVVDDGSTDGTGQACEGIDPRIRVITHRKNRGVGAARNTGVTEAKGAYVLMTDADGTYPCDTVPEMVERLDECDMIIGARVREAGTHKFLRTFAKDSIRKLASFLTETKIPDLNSGLRGFHRDLVPQFFNILPTGHSWVSTITMAFLSSGYDVEWVPIEYNARIGKSTFHPIKDTYGYVLKVIRTVMYFNPLRIFLPMALFFLGIGFLKGIYDIFAYSFHFAPSTLILLFTGLQMAVIGLLGDLVVRRTR